ncbi:hypothetical protein J5N97_011920 [Dioscorea zingiberensis]|uniref:Secreted protein n=1 Tax=Dioscorea zingiberensis TaxID=325984 RepID=A0A9D5D3Z8_9LILI|nr:hypothetical protein J5N97_011920 [Dioscorea zingiberensis]
MMLWQILIGSALTCHLTRSHVKMKKREPAAKFSEDALVPRHVKGALHASVLDVKPAVLWIVAARPAWTLPGMWKLDRLGMLGHLPSLPRPFIPFWILGRGASFEE